MNRSEKADEFIPMVRRPRTVAVVATFLFFSAAFALVTAVSLLFPDPLWNRMWDLNRPAYMAFETLGKIPGVLLLALGITAGLAGAGLLRRKKWAWWIALAIFTISGLRDVVTLVLARDLVRGGSGVLIAGAFLFFLTRPRVKRYFEEDARDRGFI